MTVVEDALPQDLAALKALVLAQRQALAEKDQTLARKTAEIEHLQAQLNLLLAKRFGPSSEKVSADQLRLFNGKRCVICTLALPDRIPRGQVGRKQPPSPLRNTRGLDVSRGATRLDQAVGQGDGAWGHRRVLSGVGPRAFRRCR
jgi:uncharacterized coiled-coil protein SlyX